MATELQKWVMDVMYDKLDEMEGLVVDISTLPETMFDAEIAQGGYSCDAQKARKWYEEYHVDLCMAVDREIKRAGSINYNPLDLEKLEVHILVSIAHDVISAMQLSEYEKEFELTEKIIKKMQYGIDVLYSKDLK